MSVNKAILVGRLGADPIIRSTDGGKKVANFSVATDETYKDRSTGEKVKKTEWFRIVAWDKLADIVEEYLHKGDMVYVEGKFQTRQFDSKDNGTKTTTEVVANVMRMLGGNTRTAEAGGFTSSADTGEDEESPF